MSKDRWIEPTEEDKNKLSRLILNKVYEQMKHISSESDEREIVTAVINAFSLAKRIESDADRKFRDENKHNGIDAYGHHIIISWVVANAYISIINEEILDIKINELNPYNPMGASLIPFVKACLIIDKGCEYFSALNNLDEGYDLDKLYYLEDISKNVDQ